MIFQESITLCDNGEMMFALGSSACAQGGGAALWRAWLSVEATMVDGVGQALLSRREEQHGSGLGGGRGTTGICQKEGGPRDTRGGLEGEILADVLGSKMDLEYMRSCGVCDIGPFAGVTFSVFREDSGIERDSLQGGVWIILFPSCVIMRKLLSLSELQLLSHL